MRMSIRTTSGRWRSTAASTLSPSSASATTSIAVGAAEQHPQAGADQRVVVDQHHPDQSRGRSQGSVAARTKSPSAATPCASSPPASSTRSPRPIRPLPAPGSAGGGGRRAAAPGCAPRSPACPRRAPTLHPDQRAGRVLAGVRQALLDDPVGGPRRRRRGVVVRGQLELVPRSASPPPATPRSAPAGRPASAAAAAPRPSVPSRSTPITSRSSSSAAAADSRTTPAVASISAGGASGRYSSAPACRLSSEIRWARTSCISRAIRSRSAAARLLGAQPRLPPRAAPPARAADSTRSRRTRTKSPQPTRSRTAGCRPGSRRAGRGRWSRRGARRRSRRRPSRRRSRSGRGGRSGSPR